MVDTSSTGESAAHTFHYEEAWWKDLRGRCSRRNQLYEQFLYPNVSMHTFPKNEKVRDQWVKFVNVHRPDWKPTSNSALCSVHFHESCFTRLKLSRLLPANISDENSISSEESSSTKPKEKRVLVTGSVPTIQCVSKHQ